MNAQQRPRGMSTKFKILIYRLVYRLDFGLQRGTKGRTTGVAHLYLMAIWQMVVSGCHLGDPSLRSG